MEETSSFQISKNLYLVVSEPYVTRETHDQFIVVGCVSRDFELQALDTILFAKKETAVEPLPHQAQLQRRCHIIIIKHSVDHGHVFLTKG